MKFYNCPASSLASARKESKHCFPSDQRQISPINRFHPQYPNYETHEQATLKAQKP